MSQNPGPSHDSPDAVTEAEVDEVREEEISDDEVARSAPMEGTDQDPASYLDR